MLSQKSMVEVLGLGTQPARHNCSIRQTVVVRTAELSKQVSSMVSSASTSQCPFLAGLRTPPVAQMPWLRRVQLLLTKPGQLTEHYMAQRGSDTMVQVLGQPGFHHMYMPGTLDLVKDVFANEATGTTTSALAEEAESFFAHLFGVDSIVAVKDPERHKQLRYLMAPAFSADAIATYMPEIQALVSRHMCEWEAAGDAGVKAYDSLKLLTFDFIMQVAIGKSIPAAELQHLSKLFEILCNGLFAWPYLNLPFSPWHQALRARSELVIYFQAAITAARAAAAAGGEVPGLLGRLVTAENEEGNRLSDQELCNNLLLILFAGHDTSSTTLTRCLSNLQDHPEVMQRLRDEQAEIVSQKAEGISAAVLKDMQYAEAVIRETLKIDPVVRGIPRLVTRDFQLGDYAVPANTSLTLPLAYLAHKDPRWTHETGSLHPFTFTPERFLTPQGAKPGHLMPFGAGVRYCLGAGLAMAEMKVFLALLARHYDFTADNNTAWKPALGDYPENRLPLVIKRRQMS